MNFSQLYNKLQEIAKDISSIDDIEQLIILQKEATDIYAQLQDMIKKTGNSTKEEIDT